MSPHTLSLFVPAFFATIALPLPALAQGSKVSSAVELARSADKLKPGQWVWAPTVAPDGPVMVYVDLSTQLATIYRNGIRIGVATVSSGKAGHETPTGVFTILQKDADHRSSKYNSAPMPYMQRLTWDGVALHAGGLPGYPESHGCVHLPYEFAQELFGITKTGVTVVVEGNAAKHVRTSEASLLAPFDAKGQPLSARTLDGDQYRWEPQLAAKGPLSIIVSKSDQRIVVMRGGVEIGRSAAKINAADSGSHVITLTADKDGKQRWIYLGLPGHEEEAGRTLDEAALNRVQMPRGFYDAVRGVLEPGSTILVTQSSVGASPGMKITVLDAVKPVP